MTYNCVSLTCSDDYLASSPGIANKKGLHYTGVNTNKNEISTTTFLSTQSIYMLNVQRLVPPMI